MIGNARLAKLERMSFEAPVPRDDRERSAPATARGWRRRSALLAAVAAALGLVLGCIAVLRPDNPQRASAGRATTTVKPSAVGPSTVVPTTPPTTGLAVTTTSTSAGVPVAPGRLVIATPTLDFGTTGVLRQLRLRNSGGQPVLWSAAGGAGWVSVAPASGGIEGGEETLVAVSLDRVGAPQGPLATAIIVTGAEGRVPVALTGTVDHPPRLTSQAIDEAELYPQTGDCEPVRATVTATVEGPDLASVVLGWRTPDNRDHTLVMTSSGVGVWQGRLGPFPASGDIGWWVVATDAGGKRARSIDRVLRVLDCVPS